VEVTNAAIRHAGAGTKLRVEGGNEVTTRVGINGFGRIGRAFARLAYDKWGYPSRLADLAVLVGSRL